MTQAQTTERRGAADREMTANVRHGISLQQLAGTPSAVEYLMARGFDGGTVRRVLGSTALRSGDRAAPPVVPPPLP